MTQRAIPASFWRGGTSRGLLFRASTLSPYPPSVRHSIILSALGSPDPDGRQISGLGGGVSSLSKVAIVGLPGEGVEDMRKCGPLPGVKWADGGEESGRKVEWDIVYRFGQVGVRDTGIDWSATCGNMLSAVALSSLTSSILPYSTLFLRSRSLPPPPPDQPLLFPLSILSASNGSIMKAFVPLDPLTLQVWIPKKGEGEKIAGVPGNDEPGIKVEIPIASEGGGLVSGREKDTIEFEGKEISFSLLSSGLPNIFLPITSLSLPASILTLPSSSSSHTSLLPTLESLRTSIAHKFSIPLSLASPKIVLVSSCPIEGYTTSGGEKVGEKVDLLARAISGGDWHASIPGTTLGALNIGAGTPNTVIHDLITKDSKKGDGKEVTVRVGHAAGVADSTLKFKEGKPEAVVMMRTAREIMRGEVMVPERVFEDKD